MTLHGRMKKNEFGYAVTDSCRLVCKIRVLANDWEDLLISDPDHRNAKHVVSAMIL